MPRTALLTAAIMVLCAGTLAAQTAPSAPSSRTTAGAYDGLSPANRKIVSAIYEAQLGSRNDRASGKLLTRDQIAVLRRRTDWSNAYRRLYERGMVTVRHLGQAISSYNHVPAAGGLTVITTAGGEQLIFGAGRANNTRSAAATSGAGRRVATKVEPDKSAGVTNPGASAGANAAEATTTAVGASLVGSHGFADVGANQ